MPPFVVCSADSERSDAQPDEASEQRDAPIEQPSLSHPPTSGRNIFAAPGVDLLTILCVHAYVGCS